MNLTFSFLLLNQLTDNSVPGANLDPKLRARLLQESRTPFRGVRRVLWVALFGSSLIGLFVMGLRASSGEIVLFKDAGIQLFALLLFGFLLFFDRQSENS